MRFWIIIIWILAGIACREEAVERKATGMRAPVFPDYSGCVVPANIAPLNFEVMRRSDEVEAAFWIGDQRILTCRGDQFIDIPVKKWRKLLEKTAAGKEVKLVVACRIGKVWEEYLPVTFQVAPEPVDDWIAYRLIYPGYEGWANMGIYQRCLSDFREKTVIDNTLTGGNCMNCHCFSHYSPDRFVMHMRGKVKGTLLADNGETSLVKGEMNGQTVPLVYPAWHPSGKQVAFSSNATFQFFHASTEKLVEVYDETSDIVLYNTVSGEVMTDSSLLARRDMFETYPAWTPSGDRLFFCRTDSVPMPEAFKQIRYTICSVGFDTLSNQFYGPVDTVLSIPGKSVVFPRISPNGRYLLVTTLDYGCFPVWHKEADLLMWDLQKKQAVPHDANSFDSESYHVWSSNGKWVMFTSRRTDGLFTRLWFSYVDDNGRLCKPFPLPQQGDLLRDTRMRSYNVPEFIQGEITVSARKLLETVND